MAHHFDAKNAPFDRLTAEEVDTVRDALDIVYFRPNETIVGRDKAPDSLFIVIKGLVEERDGDDLVALRGPGDAFDSRALVQGGGSNAFVAREETLCNLLPRDVTLRLINQNPRFASFFYLDIARKLGAATREEEAARFAPLLAARVRDLLLHPAVFMDAKDTIADAGARMKAANCHALSGARRRRGQHRDPDGPPERGGSRSPLHRKPDRAARAPPDHQRRSRRSRLDRLAQDDEAQQAAGGGL